MIDDSRMSVERPFVRDWNLLIRHVTVEDNGQYTCQVNTDPIQIKRVWLTVHGMFLLRYFAFLTNFKINCGHPINFQHTKTLSFHLCCLTNHILYNMAVI